MIDDLLLLLQVLLYVAVIMVAFFVLLGPVIEMLFERFLGDLDDFDDYGGA